MYRCRDATSVCEGENMRKFGWFFIIAYCIDAVVSPVATFTPAARSASSVIGYVLIPLCVVVFVLACMGKLRPRLVFIIPTCFYFFLIVVWRALNAILMAMVMKESFITLMDIVYNVVVWPLVILNLIIAAYIFIAYRRAQSPAEITSENKP
jgi:hypothetical protein